MKKKSLYADICFGCFNVHVLACTHNNTSTQIGKQTKDKNNSSHTCTQMETYVHKRNVKSVERCTEQKEKEIERAREILNGERKIYVGI